MKLKNIALNNIAILSLFICGFIACEEEFATIDSDIINEDTATNFDVVSEKFEVISYTNVLDPVQSSNLGLQQLGFYKGLYGETTASVVTQVNTSIFNPSFGENPVLESVTLSIPYFSRNIGTIGDNEVNYEVDSIFPRIEGDDEIKEYAPIKLSLFENDYFLRDFDPNGDFDDMQLYYSNRSLSSGESIDETNLESRLIATIEELAINDREIRITEENDDGEEVVTERFSPRIQEIWTRGASTEDDAVIAYWTQKIFEADETLLSNSNNFNNYFKGIYFKAESINDNGSLMLLNLSQPEANITLNYSFDSTNEDDEDGRDESTFTLTFGPNRINFIDNNDNSSTVTFPTNDGDEVNGDDRLYIRGGQGAIANIDLTFNSTTNSLLNNFDNFKTTFANYNQETGEFESFNRLINEANLIFYVDQEELANSGINTTNNQEPIRLYLYNKTNGTPLADYFLDLQNNTLPLISIPNHLGILERDDDGNGLRYKMRITQHIINLLTTNDSENVQLGLAISGNVNLEATVPQLDVLNPTDEDETIPLSSIINPRGTVLHGNASIVEDKKLQLQIIYSCPDSGNCNNE